MSSQLAVQIPFDDEAVAPAPRVRHLTAVETPTRLFDNEDPSHQLVRSIAAQSFEVIEGTRNVASLGSVIGVAAARELAMQRSLITQRNSVHAQQRTIIVGAGRVQTCRLSELVTEASIVLHTNKRSHAVAMRLEWTHNRWRATVITVL